MCCDLLGGQLGNQCNLQLAMEALDVSGDGFIEYHEFLAAVVDRQRTLTDHTIAEMFGKQQHPCNLPCPTLAHSPKKSGSSSVQGVRCGGMGEDVKQGPEEGSALMACTGVTMTVPPH